MGLDLQGQPSAALLRSAGINAALQSGLANPLDEAVLVVMARSLAMRGTRGQGAMAQVECSEASLQDELARVQADRRLMRAAPAMLEALRMHAALPAWPDRKALGAAMDATRGAIALAESGSDA